MRPTKAGVRIILSRRIHSMLGGSRRRNQQQTRLGMAHSARVECGVDSPRSIGASFDAPPTDIGLLPFSTDSYDVDQVSWATLGAHRDRGYARQHIFHVSMPRAESGSWNTRTATPVLDTFDRGVAGLLRGHDPLGLDLLGGQASAQSTYENMRYRSADFGT